MLNFWGTALFDCRKHSPGGERYFSDDDKHSTIGKSPSVLKIIIQESINIFV